MKIDWIFNLVFLNFDVVLDLCIVQCSRYLIVILKYVYYNHISYYNNALEMLINEEFNIMTLASVHNTMIYNSLKIGLHSRYFNFSIPHYFCGI